MINKTNHRRIIAKSTNKTKAAWRAKKEGYPYMISEAPYIISGYPYVISGSVLTYLIFGCGYLIPGRWLYIF